MQHIKVINEKGEIIGSYKICEGLWGYVRSYLELAEVNSRVEKEKE